MPLITPLFNGVCGATLPSQWAFRLLFCLYLKSDTVKVEKNRPYLDNTMAIDPVNRDLSCVIVIARRAFLLSRVKNYLLKKRGKLICEFSFLIKNKQSQRRAESEINLVCDS